MRYRLTVSVIPVTPDLSIPLSEVAFETSRSSGPGGQHVNKTESRVTLVFDLEASTTLDEDSKRRIAERYSSRISKRGELRVSAQSSRSQRVNRETAIERFADLVRQALAPVEKRVPTRPTAASRRRRVDAKRRQSGKKAMRRKPVED